MNTVLTKRGRKPNLYILDNEASADLKASLAKQNINYQLVPPHVHRRNAAERAIRTFKNNFLSGLASLILKLLHNSRANPKLSVYIYLFGNFNFNHTPLAPPGTRVVVHKKPSNRKSWDHHGVDGFYIGPVPDHYRCVSCFVPSPRRILDADTVQFFPHKVQLPQTQTEDFLRQAAQGIVHLL